MSKPYVKRPGDCECGCTSGNCSCRPGVDQRLPFRNPGPCKARQHSDQMLCECGLGWDVNDPDPPVCRSTDVANQLKATRAMLREPARFAGRNNRLLSLAEMPLNWLPACNVPAGLYSVKWDSLPDVVFVVVAEKGNTGRHYQFFNVRGGLAIEVLRQEAAPAFQYRYPKGEWLHG